MNNFFGRPQRIECATAKRQWGLECVNGNSFLFSVHNLLESEHMNMIVASE